MIISLTKKIIKKLSLANPTRFDWTFHLFVGFGVCVLYGMAGIFLFQKEKLIHIEHLKPRKFSMTQLVADESSSFLFPLCCSFFWFAAIGFLHEFRNTLDFSVRCSTRVIITCIVVMMLDECVFCAFHFDGKRSDFPSFSLSMCMCFFLSRLTTNNSSLYTINLNVNIFGTKHLKIEPSHLFFCGCDCVYAYDFEAKFSSLSKSRSHSIFLSATVSSLKVFVSSSRVCSHLFYMCFVFFVSFLSLNFLTSNDYLWVDFN